MELGNFSISLAVKDVKVSRDFYMKLGFEVFGGDAEQGWLILKNGTTNIGLFQGMFDKNTLTFNPGWDHAAQELDEFADVRDIQSTFKEAGIKLESEVEEGTTGPGHFFFFDPDGNPILVDQHR